MASPACCAAGPPVISSYEPKGTMLKIGGGETYMVGSGPKSLIVIYDIFGFSTQVKQVCDILASSGYSVALPDFFKGNELTHETFGALRERGEFMQWANTTGGWENEVLPTLKMVMNHMRDSNSSQMFGVIGFCWGGNRSMKAAALGPEAGIKAASCVHPALFSEELAADIKVPVLVMPAKDDADHGPFKEILDKKEFGNKCKYHRFDDMHHGFCASRGDWTDAVQATRASEAIGMMQQFFGATLQ